MLASSSVLHGISFSPIVQHYVSSPTSLGLIARVVALAICNCTWIILQLIRISLVRIFSNKSDCIPGVLSLVITFAGILIKLLPLLATLPTSLRSKWGFYCPELMLLDTPYIITIDPYHACLDCSADNCFHRSQHMNI